MADYLNQALNGIGGNTNTNTSTNTETNAETNSTTNTETNTVDPTPPEEEITGTVSKADEIVWENGTAKVELEANESGYTIQYKINKVKGLPYSEKAKAYLATQIELDKALEELITRLEEKGKLEDTVIIITGDHYPYGLTTEEMQEISENKMDDEFERFNMPFICYNSAETEKIVSNKYSSSLDVLPTILNLFGVEYDSRLLMGKDIFSDSEPLVIFSDRSFITNSGKYNSTTGNFEGEEVGKEYIEKIKKVIYYKYRYSRLILENDFYKYIFLN